VDLEYTRACAHQTSAREVHVSSQIICDVGVETPAINYAQFNGKPYQVSPLLVNNREGNGRSEIFETVKDAHTCSPLVPQPSLQLQKKNFHDINKSYRHKETLSNRK
jgi:hypothetical protein